MSGISSDPPVAAAEPPIRFRFRIVHLLYSIAVFASAFAVFGLWGFLVAGLAVAFWLRVFLGSSRPHIRAVDCVVLLGILLPIVACIPPAVTNARRAAQRSTCSSRMYQLTFALLSYQDDYGQLPPAYIADAQGRPMHSWRVLILPYMEEQALYNRYDFSEPWDGPNNSKLLAEMPRSYSCSTHQNSSGAHRQCTSYVAVVGDGTLWPGAESRKLDDERQPASNAVLLVEDSSAQIPWLEPRDWSVEVAMARLSSSDPKDRGPHSSEDYFYQHSGGRNAVTGGRDPKFLPDGLERETCLELLTISDSDDPQHLEGWPAVDRTRRLNVGNCLRLATFVLLVVLPVPWVFRKSKAPTIGSLPTDTTVGK